MKIRRFEVGIGFALDEGKRKKVFETLQVHSKSNQVLIFSLKFKEVCVMFKRSMVVLFTMVFLAVSLSAAFSGERGFARDLGKASVKAESCGASCGNAAVAVKAKSPEAQKCKMTGCKCENCFCGDSCALKGCGSSCVKAPGCPAEKSFACEASCAMKAGAKSCERSAGRVMKAEAKSCVCAASCECAAGPCAMKSACHGEKNRTACRAGECCKKMKGHAAPAAKR